MWNSYYVGVIWWRTRRRPPRLDSVIVAFPADSRSPARPCRSAPQSREAACRRFLCQTFCTARRVRWQIRLFSRNCSGWPSWVATRLRAFARVSVRCLWRIPPGIQRCTPARSSWLSTWRAARAFASANVYTTPIPTSSPASSASRRATSRRFVSARRSCANSRMTRRFVAGPSRCTGSSCTCWT